MFLERIFNNLTDFQHKTAFCINNNFYTYKDFSGYIKSIQNKILKFIDKGNDNKPVVIYTYDDIQTYATIFACWFLGLAIVPLNPQHPRKRNELIKNQIDPLVYFSSKEQDINENYILTKDIRPNTEKPDFNNFKKDSLIYILFTSGSTGKPKGVCINYSNLNAFIYNYLKTSCELDTNDRFLQFHELTFDASLHCYVLPLVIGASVFTVPLKSIKYIEAYRIMNKNKITFSKFPPSVLNYLQSYFKEIKLKHLRYSLLGGEAFNCALVEDWQKCIPNARIQNVYGPTEATVVTHSFDWNINQKNKIHNGIISIGKPFGSNKAIITDENNNILPANVKGELCLGGDQITPGYLNDEIKNKTLIFEIIIEGEKTRFYKTGDIAYVDNDGDFMYCGRIDNQVQIQGYRVELNEIENIAIEFGMAQNYVVVSNVNKLGNQEIIIYAEKLKVPDEELLRYIKTKLPAYMIPSVIIKTDQLPLLPSGKIDRNKLTQLVKNE